MRQIRKVLALALTVPALLLILASCGEGQSVQQRVDKIREDILQAQRLVINAQIIADYGDRVYEFTIRYTGFADAGEIAVLAPEQVAGITAEVMPDGVTLVFDGARLDTGPLTNGGLTPVGAIPWLISEWQSGSIAFVGAERFGDTDTLTFETAVDESVSQRTWFDSRTLLPIRSEIRYNGVMVVLCIFSNVIIE